MVRLMETTLFSNSQLMYTLMQAENGALILNATCGEVALYGVKVELTTDQVEQYHLEGQTYLDWLAIDICKRPTRYKFIYS